MASFILNQIELTEYAAEVMVYFERHKLIEIITRLIAEIVLERPEDVQQWIGQNLIRVADEIYSYCRQKSYKGEENLKIDVYQLPARFLHRIVIFGRRGSGRKTQAIELVKRFNLVYIDAEQIIYQCLRAHSDDLSKELQRAFETEDVCGKSKALDKIIARRLLQMDALRQGWVMINYPNNLREFQHVLEEFKIPPNKVIYLECKEEMAKQRLLAQPALGRPQDICEYIENEMLYFHDNEPEIKEYLKGKHEAVFVDSMSCFERVKTMVWAQLENPLYLMGDKH